MLNILKYLKTKIEDLKKEKELYEYEKNIVENIVHVFKQEIKNLIIENFKNTKNTNETRKRITNLVKTYLHNKIDNGFICCNLSNNKENSQNIVVGIKFNTLNIKQHYSTVYSRQVIFKFVIKKVTKEK